MTCPTCLQTALGFGVVSMVRVSCSRPRVGRRAGAEALALALALTQHHDTSIRHRTASGHHLCRPSRWTSSGCAEKSVDGHFRRCLQQCRAASRGTRPTLPPAAQVRRWDPRLQARPCRGDDAPLPAWSQHWPVSRLRALRCRGAFPLMTDDANTRLLKSMAWCRIAAFCQASRLKTQAITLCVSIEPADGRCGSQK